MKTHFVAFVLLLFAFAPVCVFAQAPTLPTAPTLMDTTQPNTTGYDVLLVGSAQTYTTFLAAYTAIAGANLTNGVIVRADASFTDTVTSTRTLPYKNMSAGKWIITETTSSGTSCPASGTRLTIAGAATANLASIKTTTGITTMIATAVGSGGNTPHHYWFRCMVLETTAALTDIVRIGASETSSANLPHHFVFDRVYVKAPDTVEVRRCITGNGNSIAVIDSTLAYCITTNSGSGADSQAFGSWNGEGPFKIVNDYLSASAEIVMFGGAVPNITNLIGSDIEVRQNYFFKPLTWRYGKPGADGINRVVKNHFEIKNAQRILFSGNVLENCWAASQRSCFVFTPKSSGSATWAVAWDIEILNTRVTSAANVFNVSGVITAEPADVTRRLYVHEMLTEDISDANWGSGTDGIFFQTTWPFSGTQYPRDITIAHVTVFETYRGVNPNTNGEAFPATPMPNFYFTDSLMQNGSGGAFRGQGASGEGDSTINSFFTGGVSVTRNVFQNGTSGNYAGHPGNFFDASWSTVKFISQTGLFCANCDLDPTSPYYSAGAGGTKIGLSNWTTFGQATCGAVGGDWTCAGGLPAPTVASIAPTSGVYTGGTAVTITGTNYVAGAVATFDAIACTSIVVVSATSITCNTPAHAAGAVNVVVTNPDLQVATLTNGYTYTGSGAATIATVSPTTGSFLGGSRLNITGTNFAQGLVVLVGGQTCGNTTVTTTTIACDLPPNTLGLKDVSVTNPSAAAVTASNAFTYNNTRTFGVPVPR